MSGSIQLQAAERKRLLELYRKSPQVAVRLRAHILLLLDDGHPWTSIEVMLYTSSSTIGRWRRAYLQGGVAAIEEERRGGRTRMLCGWIALLIHWVTQRTPRDFGFFRSRWSCAALALLLWERRQVPVSAETVRRQLAQAGLVWRRPRPALGLEDPEYAQKLGQIQQLLWTLPSNEAALFQDEVDLHTNPKIGAMWMWRGQQAEVVTPGTNQKSHLAGSLNWRSGQLLVTAGSRRNSALFVEHLEELRQRLRRYCKIHVICDNAKFHTSQLVQRYLAQWGHRVQLHFLPKYAPQTNPVERVWWRLHEEITRNHRCPSSEDLTRQAVEWLEWRSPFETATSVYDQTLAA